MTRFSTDLLSESKCIASPLARQGIVTTNSNDYSFRRQLQCCFRFFHAHISPIFFIEWSRRFVVSADVIIVGAGIVGLATAWQLSSLHPQLKIIVIDKEATVASHQTGHNSGVLHSGIYYQPGSLKAENCRLGKLAIENFCNEYGIPFERCGKVIVAVDESELKALDHIFRRGQQNRVQCRIISREQLHEHEPHVAGIRAIHVPDAGIVDYRKVALQLALLLRERQHEIMLGQKVIAVHHPKTPKNAIVVLTESNEYRCRLVVNCGGLHCDRVSAIAGLRPAAKIIPFRGEYYELIPERRHLCRNLIYPVPDPKFPFLGVHFTRMIGGGVECGPNAVLAFSREGYRKRDINPTDLIGTFMYPGFWKMAFRHWRMGCGEMWRSLNKRAFVKALQRLMPEIRKSDLVPAPAGVRAQALLRDGKLVDDFLIEENESMISVLNAPSPAATASLNIGKLVADRVAARIK